MTSFLCVDVGGTKLAAGVVDDRGAILAEDRMATPRGTHGAALMDALWGLCEKVLAVAGPVEACGVGCGGPMSPGGETVSPLNIPAWRDFPLRRELAGRLARPVYVDNDAKALALAEGWVGAAARQRHFLAMVVSTGVGGGIVVDGRLLDGATGNAGHIGHLIVEPEGRRCECGAFGCLEAEASGTAIAAITGKPASEAGPEVRARVGTLVGRAVAGVVSLLDIRLAVVGGSVALGYGEDFLIAAREELAARARLDFAVGAELVLSDLGPSGGLLGAAALARRSLGYLPG